MDYEINFLKALLITITIETTVLFLLVKIFFKKHTISNYIILLTGILASFSTLPYLWFIFPLFIKTKVLYIIICESFAVLFESAVIMGLLRTTYIKALIISIICNMSSYLIGLFIHL